MFRKLFLAYLLLVVLALAVFGVLAARSTRRRVLDEITLRLQSQAEMLKPLVRDGEAQGTVVELGRRLDARLTVIDGSGVVLADSHGDPAQMDNHNFRPEVQEARARGQGSHVRYSDTVRYGMIYFAARLEPDRADGRIVRSALPLTRVEAELRSLYLAIAVAFLTIAAAGAALTYMLARWVTRPLRELEGVAHAIASGDFSKRAPLRATREFGSVAQAMNRMADELSVRLDRLQAERAKLEAVVSSMEEGVLATDRDGIVLHSNGAVRMLFGLSGDPQGLKVWEAVRVPELAEAVREVLRGGASVRRTVDAGSRAVALCISPTEGAQGAVLVARDVTEERRYDALRKEFVANVSHELRTPLSLIRGYVETLASGAWRDERAAPGFLQTIEENVERLSRLVQDLLELSRLESGGQVVNRRSVDVLGLLEKVCVTYRPLAERKRQALSFEGVAGTVVLDADPDLLERAVSNLVDNAVKYTPEGGRIQVRASANGEAFEIAVDDNGVGIPEADLPRVFERFYRVDKSRSRDLGGTGLGLAIVKHVAQLHGGAVEARSQVGRGSTFTLRIPRSPAPSTGV